MADKLSFKEKFQKVQYELKAPKNMYNSFGKYKYRNAEGICEAFKPFGEKYGLILTLQDEMVEVGSRIYVKARAQLVDIDSDEFCEVSALARESEDKKGMDAAQVTGSTSSYARKYALNGLFLLDDTKDADSDEYKTESDSRAKKAPKITEKGLKELNELIKKADVNESGLLEMYHISDLAELTVDQFISLKSRLTGAIAKKEGKNGTE